MGRLRPQEVLARGDGGKDRESWAYQEMGRQYTQMSLEMALDLVEGEGGVRLVSGLSSGRG